MIPKKIHYCWFGRGEKPAMAKKCIASWKKYMPDYEIIEWNEDNFNVGYNSYTKMCYEQKKYAFLTDYLRLLIIYEHGGIYFDTDVEAIKSFDDLLDCEAFFGFETEKYINTGEGFGAEAGNSIVRQMIEEYLPLLDGAHGTIGCPILNTNALTKFNLELTGKAQIVQNARILPIDYLNPLDSSTGKLRKTMNTYSIHWYSASWQPFYIRLRTAVGKPIRRFLYELFGRK